MLGNERDIHIHYVKTFLSQTFDERKNMKCYQNCGFPPENILVGKGIIYLLSPRHRQSFMLELDVKRVKEMLIPVRLHN